jgi:hypothetical protein
VAPSGALAWLAGTYYGRTSAGLCSVTIQADGTVSATLNGSTQTGALDGEAGDTWLQQPTNSWAFGVNAVAAGQGVSLTGYAGRLVLAEVGGVLDKCAVAFRSATALTMAPASTPPLPIKSTGLTAADLPAWLIGTHAGHVAGTFLYPRAATAACSLRVAADGTVVLEADGRSYSAQVSGGASASNAGDRDTSAASRISAYTALTGARDWLWTITAQSPAPNSETVQIEIELAHNGERSQVSYATAQFKPQIGGLAREFDSCYFGQ